MDEALKYKLDDAAPEAAQKAELGWGCNTSASSGSVAARYLCCLMISSWIFCYPTYTVLGIRIIEYRGIPIHQPVEWIDRGILKTAHMTSMNVRRWCESFWQCHFEDSHPKTTTGVSNLRFMVLL